MERFRIGNGQLGVEIKADGAELCSLRDAHGRELLWQAEPAWPRHAPVLFPIVGRLAGDRLEHEGVSYHLSQHGFARDRRFALLEHGPAVCRLALSDDTETRALYPFAFRLEIAFLVEENRLTVRHTLSNPGTATLPAALGAHPAFRWPLIGGVAKDAHHLEFAADEPAPVRRVAGGLLTPERHPSPIEDRRLQLSEALFADDALILDAPASRSVRYVAPGAPVIEVAWTGFEQLGLWSRAGGDFLCIEPWHGYASPQGFDGTFRDKPGLMHLPPGSERVLEYSVTLS